MKKIFTVIVITLGLTVSLQAQEVIRLYPGVAPGSEKWDWSEQNLGPAVRDVVTPTLIAYLPERPNGIALIIAPGGAFHFLAVENEGINLARRLNEAGITVFVLKYRLVHEDPDHPYIMKMFQEGGAALMDSVSRPLIPLAVQDGITAIKYVRTHARQYNIAPDRIGIEGSSAGGTIAMSVALTATDDGHPNFVASTYGYAPLVIGSMMPDTPMPLFICAAGDDPMVPVQQSIGFYNQWLEAKQPVEMHLYQKGGHGFVGNPQNAPVDTWSDRFIDWLFMIYPQTK
jgi:acetyl esterase/lipase